jgi:hypothetical protein
MARRHLLVAGVSKAFGTAGLPVLAEVYYPVAESALRVEKAQKRLARRQVAVLERERELVALREEVLRHHRELLPRAEALFAPPPLPVVKPGTLADYTPGEFEIRARTDAMVRRQVQRMNGFSHVDGSGPEAPEGRDV